MAEDIHRNSRIIQEHWEVALRKCVEAGIHPEEATLAMIEISCGCLKGALGGKAAKAEIIRIRDEIFAELTLAADRCL